MFANILLGIQTLASAESLLAILVGLICGIIIGEGQDIVYPEYDNHLYFTRNLAICKAFV